MITTLFWLSTLALGPVALADDTDTSETAPTEEAPPEEAPPEEAPPEEAPTKDKPANLNDEPDARQLAREEAQRQAADAVDAVDAAAAVAAAEAAQVAAAAAANADPTMAPVGFRVGTPMPIDLAGTRTVLIFNPGDQVLLQTVPSTSLNFGHYGFEAELPMVLETGPSGEFIGGIGALNTGHWFRFHGDDNRVFHAIGVKGGAALVPHRYRVDSWGSVHQETINTFWTQLGWHVQWNPDAPMGIRFLMGLGGANHTIFKIYPAAELDFTKAIPLGDTTWLILEQDLLVDMTPASFRPMVRWEINGGMLDLGLQLPWASWASNEDAPASVQAITQYQHLF